MPSEGCLLSLPVAQDDYVLGAGVHQQSHQPLAFGVDKVELLLDMFCMGSSCSGELFLYS
jgi:hypothetical protein